MADDLLRSLIVPSPYRGLWEQPASIAPDYPADAAPELENIRISRRSIDVRLGFAVWKATGGSGTFHFLYRFYGSNGTNYTLAAQNGVLYQQTPLVSAGAFVASAGGGSLGTSPKWGQYNAVTVKDTVYFLDRTGALRKWDVATGVQTVMQGTAPTVAPGTLRRTWGYLVPAAITTDKQNTWQGTAGDEPTGWDDTAQVVATISDTSLDAVPDFPGGGGVCKVAFASSGTKNDEVVLDAATAITLQTHDIALFLQQSAKRAIFTFGIGANKAGEFEAKIDPPEADQTYVWHYPIGNLPSIKYLRFKVKRAPAAAQTCYLSRIFLPGRLFGKYRYRISFAKPSTYKETSLGPASGFVDCSEVITDYQSDGTACLEKSVALNCGANTLPAVGTLTHVNFYRSGGLPELTRDSRGQEKWLRVHQGGNINSSVGATASMGALVLDVPKDEGAENLAAGDWVVVERGVAAKEEYVKIVSVTLDFSGALDRLVLDASTPIQNAHSISTSNKVEPAYLDNTANESIDTTTVILPERNDAPSGSHWISVAPDGRLWIARTDNPLEVCISNLPTAARQWDHEVFPDGVEPLTTGSLLQGFRFLIDGDAHGDEITWAGFYQRVFTVFTQRACYQVHASGQSDWNTQAVVKLWDNVGCMAGETVEEVNGVLYWVADGPRVMRWDGRGQPDDISFQKLSTTLAAAPTTYIPNWFALGRADKDGARYDLFLTPSGATTNTMLLSWNVVLGVWERHVYYAAAGTARADLVINASDNTKITSAGTPFAASDIGKTIQITAGTGFTTGYYVIVNVVSAVATLNAAVGTVASTGGSGTILTALPWVAAIYQAGPADARELYAAHPTSGNIRLLESTTADNGAAIPVAYSSKKFTFDGMLVKAEHLFAYYVGTGADTLSFRIRMSDSEYRNVTDFASTDGDPAQTVSKTLADTDTSEAELYARLDFTRTKGRSFALRVSGSVSNGPSVNRVEFRYSAVRRARITG